MVEQYSITSEDSVTLSVIDRGPIGINLGNGIGTARIKGSRLFLWCLQYLAIHFGATRLVKFGLESCFPYRFEKADRAQSRHVSRIFRDVKAHTHMALGREMIDLIGLEAIKKLDQICGVRYIAIMQKQFHSINMGILIKVINPSRVKC